MDDEQLLALLGAVGQAQRPRVIARQQGARFDVGELPRKLGLSRPPLSVHLDSLETAGLVTGGLELSPGSKAMKVLRAGAVRGHRRHLHDQLCCADRGLGNR